MTDREHAPVGSPCWIDLWTSDVPTAREFYSGLFGWTAEEPSPEFGGYFMFTREGKPVAGAMGDMGGMEPENTWKIYLATENIEKSVQAAEKAGARVVLPSMSVADLGIQGAVLDPTGAYIGLWQPETFPGFTVLDEHGSPSWFELHTREYATAVAFYGSVFAWDLTAVGDSEQFRYSAAKVPGGEVELAGILDAGAFLPEGVPGYWTVYWEVDDVDASVAMAQSLGGSVEAIAEDTPYGRVSTVKDPMGASFRLRTGPRG